MCIDIVTALFIVTVVSFVIVLFISGLHKSPEKGSTFDHPDLHKGPPY
jgi:hypothetical protein